MNYSLNAYLVCAAANCHQLTERHLAPEHWP